MHSSVGNITSGLSPIKVQTAHVQFSAFLPSKNFGLDAGKKAYAIRIVAVKCYWQHSLLREIHSEHWPLLSCSKNTPNWVKFTEAWQLLAIKLCMIWTITQWKECELDEYSDALLCLLPFPFESEWCEWGSANEEWIISLLWAKFNQNVQFTYEIFSS